MTYDDVPKQNLIYRALPKDLVQRHKRALPGRYRVRPSRKEVVRFLSPVFSSIYITLSLGIGIYTSLTSLFWLPSPPNKPLQLLHFTLSRFNDGLVRGQMPATSLTIGQSIFADHQTLRRIRPLENGFECNVKEEMYRGLASADMMEALTEVIEMNREDARMAAGERFEEIAIQL